MPKQNYQINGTSDSSGFDQTDFGRIYYNLPHKVYEPENIKELATLLKKLNYESIPIKVRNTGHSVNGQTLTDGVQLNLSKLKYLKFNEKTLEVTTGVGNSWDEVLCSIKFPIYCLGMFPNNPGQQIHIGGTASVGGAGPYSFSSGGFWNLVKSLKLVTMTGEIIECSNEKNSDYFKFALGGFGRIGIIAELTLKVITSKTHVLNIVSVYPDFKSYENVLKLITADNKYEGVFGLAQVSAETLFDPLAIFPYGVVVSKELNEGESPEDITNYFRQKYHNNIIMFYGDEITSIANTKSGSEDVFFNIHKITKQHYVYYYPEDRLNKEGFYNPWSDYIVKPDKYEFFMKNGIEIIKKYGIHKHLFHLTAMHGIINADMFLTYIIRRNKNSSFFPLSLDFQDSDVAIAMGLSPIVPLEKIPAALEMTKELTDLVFSLGGKRYMYGIHSLTKEQVALQYGENTIHEWNKIKDLLDPKHLLNIGVIEHLD